MTNEYKVAHAKANEAFEVFDVVRNAYRARTIGDDEFLAAKAIYDASLADFDVAYAKEDAN